MREGKGKEGVEDGWKGRDEGKDFVSPFAEAHRPIRH